jgi:hypothetical protein
MDSKCDLSSKATLLCKCEALNSNPSLIIKKRVPEPAGCSFISESRAAEGSCDLPVKILWPIPRVRLVTSATCQPHLEETEFLRGLKRQEDC